MPTTAPAPTAAGTETIHTIDIRKEVFIAASPEISFAALLEELGPGSQMPDGKPFPMKIEPWPGGRWYRDLGEAGGHKYGHLWGHVQVIKAPTLLELTGPMPMSFPALNPPPSPPPNHAQYRPKPEARAPRLTLCHRAMGLLPQEVREGMLEGWQ